MNRCSVTKSIGFECSFCTNNIFNLNASQSELIELYVVRIYRVDIMLLSNFVYKFSKYTLNLI